jgi:peptide/nickel transport system permease protein
MIARVGGIMAKRLVSMVFILLALSAIVFLLQQLSNESPVHAYLGANASQAAIARESKILGYDRPIIDQYFHYVAGLLHGNLQLSLRTRRPVATDLGDFLPATIELTVFGLGLAMVLGTLLGLASAGRWRGAGAFRLLMISGASAPSFLLALLGILWLSGGLHLLPATGDTSLTNPPTGPTGMIVVDGLLHGQLSTAWDGFLHLLLPGFCIALGPAVSIGRVLRGSLVAAMRSDYVRTARSKGLKERAVLFRHALRNALTAPLAMTGLQAGLMFAGVVVIETVFAWPGIGLYTDESIPAGDFPAIAGVTLVLGVGYVVINTVVDILQAIADPRIELR